MRFIYLSHFGYQSYLGKWQSTPQPEVQDPFLSWARLHKTLCKVALVWANLPGQSQQQTWRCTGPFWKTSFFRKDIKAAAQKGAGSAQECRRTRHRLMLGGFPSLTRVFCSSLLFTLVGSLQGEPEGHHAFFGVPQKDTHFAKLPYLGTIMGGTE